MQGASMVGQKVTLKEVSEFLQYDDNAQYIPRYRRPDRLNPRQHEIIDGVQLPGVKIALIEGDRRTGKTNIAFLVVNEQMLSGKKRVGIMGAKLESTQAILRNMIADQLTRDAINPMLAYSVADKAVFLHGGVIRTMATTVSSAKGLDFDVLWIEEFDQILKDNPIVFGTILPILRAQPAMLIVMTANRDTGAYKLFREWFEKEADPEVRDMVKFYTITAEQCPHIKEANNDKLIEPLMELVVGRDKTQEQLHNIESFSGEVFNAHALMEALNTYDDWMMHHELVDATLHRTTRRPLATVVGVDPGFGNPTGIFVVSWYKNHFYEEHSEMIHGRGDKGEMVSEDQLKARVETLARQYGAQIVVESNSGGLWWANHWRGKGLHVDTRNFASPGSANDRESHIRELNMLLEEQRFHYKNPQLRDMAIIYSLDEKGKAANEEHGDLVDACLHGIHWLMSYGRTKEQPMTLS
jgi:hypothetical protein